MTGCLFGKSIVKVIIQIPCFNEEETLGIALDALPRKIPGVDTVEWLVVDDGSTDKTAGVAREHGVDHLLRLRTNRGLARAFMAGLDFCIKHGADIIVNTDADNQYNAGDIPLLVAPILLREAEIVVGARPISQTVHFSLVKKMLQRLGSWVVRLASGTRIPDAPSGFRAMSRDAAMRINVFDNYTYTLETIIQAGRKNMAITSVPIRTNEALRSSRLMTGIPSYIGHSLVTIVRIFMTYRPFRFFAVPGLMTLLIGLAPGIRFLYYFITAPPGAEVGHIPSLLFGITFIVAGSLLIVLGFIADLIGVNRMLLEDIRWRLREHEFQEHLHRPGR